VKDVRAWLDARVPRSPGALTLTLGEAGDVPDALLGSAIAALSRALAGEGEHAGAFELLAADALVTYACEHAVDAADPEAALLRILERLSRHGE